MPRAANEAPWFRGRASDPHAGVRRHAAGALLAGLEREAVIAEIDPVDAHLPARVGLGWHERLLRQTGRMVVWHNGGTGGYRSYLAFVPERDADVVVLVNCANDADAQGDVIMEWLLNHP